MCPLRPLILLGLLTWAAAASAEPAPAPAPVIAAGDVTADSAVLWAQADRAGTLIVELAAPEDSGQVPRRFVAEVTAADDFTAKFRVSGLAPATGQHWRAALVADGDRPGRQATGSFRTAPAADDPAPVRLLWGGDLAGQNVCRDAERGFEVFTAINRLGPDLFVGLGDMVYADGVCEAVGRYGNAQVPGGFGPAADTAGFRAHWRYSRADPGLRRLLAGTPYYAVWDDHEVVNDVGPLHDTRDQAPYRPGRHLMPLGLDVLLEQNPIAEDATTPKRLYRSIRWGRHLELLLLDTRQYRDANLAPDSEQRPKTMLGREQLTWLETRLAASDATWVVVASSVPLSVPTGWPPEQGRDGWADFDQDSGFEQEARRILASARAAGRGNLVFIAADIHFAAGFRYRPFADAPAFTVHEVITGPLSAGLFLNRDYDRDLGAERLFLFGPEDSASLGGYDAARQWLTFGELAIDADGVLTASIRDVDGEPVARLRLEP
jgi:alkaline phosphatase D